MVLMKNSAKFICEKEGLQNAGVLTPFKSGFIQINSIVFISKLHFCTSNEGQVVTLIENCL